MSPIPGPCAAPRRLLGLLLAAAAVALPAQGRPPAEVVRDARAGGEARSAALCELQDQGALPVGLLAYALAQTGTALQQTAVAVLRHEWLQWPPELFTALDASPAAAAAVLDELALAPRPVADAWVTARSLDAALPLAPRLAALAARSAPPGRAAGAMALRALGGDDDALAALCVQRLESAVADQLVSVAHERLAAGTPADRLAPLFDRFSDRGSQQLLGLVGVLDPAPAASLCKELAARGDPRFWERVRAGVDGELSLDDPWLSCAGRLLTTDARRQRIAALVGDAHAPESRRLLAFDALLEAHVYVPALLPFARAGGPERLRRLLDAGLQDLPDAALLEALRGEDMLQVAAIDAIGAGVMARAVEQRLLQLLAAADPGRPGATGALGWRLAEGLLQHGSDEGVRAALAKVRADPERLKTAYDLLGRRRDPIASAVLLTELQSLQPGARAGLPAGSALPLLDHLRLVLAETGDRRQLEDLVVAAPERSATFVRRCRNAAADLPDALARRLLARLPAVRAADARVELVLWLGRARDPQVRAGLRRLGQEDEDEDVREAALAGLMQGSERGELLADFRRAADTSGEEWRALAFEALSTMPDRLGPDDVDLLRYLLFEAPRRDAARERERAQRFPDGRTGFPLVAAIAGRLRVAPDVAAAVCAPAAELARRGDIEGLVRQRFLCLWTSLEALPELQRQVAEATAALVLAIPDAGDAGVGPATYYLARALAAAGDHDGAAAAARRAAARLLRLPAERANVRIHLGGRDPAAGVDPCAALSASSHIEAARASLQRGDKAAARRHAADAAELAGRDAAARAAIAAILAALER